MKFNRFLVSIYVAIITVCGLNAALPETMPLTPAALRAYVNNMPNKHGVVEVHGVLVGDNESYKQFDIPELGAEGILSAIGNADFMFDVVDPVLKVDLGIYVYDDSWNTLYRYSANKSVRVAKGGGYVLSDPTYQLKLNGKIWIELGEEVKSAQLVFTNGFASVDRIMNLDVGGHTGFYVKEEQLTGGAYLRLYVGEDWDEYFYSPDGKLVIPETGEVYSLAGSINGVTIVKGEWFEQVIQTYKGHGMNITYEFHPGESGPYQLPAVTSEGYAPLAIYVVYPNGKVYKFPAIVDESWNQIDLERGMVYQVFFDWGDALIEDNDHVSIGKGSSSDR